MMRQNPFEVKPSVPERVPNDGEPSVFASPDRRSAPAEAGLLETKLHDRLRGLFAITDGGASTVGGHAAALSVAEELQRQLGAPLDRKLENLLASNVAEERRHALAENLVAKSMELALMEAHTRLALANRENPGLRLRATAAVARMVEREPGQKELFYALGDGQRLYLVRDGETARVGVSEGAAVVTPGTLGEDIPMTVVHTLTLEPGDRLVLLGDGAVRTLRGADVQEAAKHVKDPRVLERTLQEFAKGRVEDPRNHEAKAGEVSVIAWEAFPAAPPKPKAEAPARETAGSRRAVLRARIKRAADTMASNAALAVPDAGGRQLLGAEEANRRLESERADAELELMNLDLPPRFQKGDRVTLATGKTYVVEANEEGKYLLHDVRSPSHGTLLRPRWEIEMAVDPTVLPVRAGDRIRVEGFTATAADDWHVMDSTHPEGRFLFEDGKGAQHMSVPAHLTRQALHAMLQEGARLQNRAFALRRQVEKTKR